MYPSKDNECLLALVRINASHARNRLGEACRQQSRRPNQLSRHLHMTRAVYLEVITCSRDQSTVRVSRRVQWLRSSPVCCFRDSILLLLLPWLQAFTWLRKEDIFMVGGGRGWVTGRDPLCSTARLTSCLYLHLTPEGQAVVKRGRLAMRYTAVVFHSQPFFTCRTRHAMWVLSLYHR